jgi:putative acetyltransferase
MSWSVKPRGADDKEAVLAVVREAFSRPGRDGEFEVGVVARTWDLGASPSGLDLVAVDGDRPRAAVLGHVLGAVGDLGGTPALAIAPLCVARSHQGQGIGSGLMKEFLRRAESGGWPLVLVLGDPRYYQRFGFEPSGPFGICYRPVGERDPHFQVRRLPEFDPSLRGEFTYSWEAPIREAPEPGVLNRRAPRTSPPHPGSWPQTPR